MNKTNKTLTCFLCAAALLSLFFVILPMRTYAAPGLSAVSVNTVRPSSGGRLHVEGTQLVDESGEAVQLRGVSTHGLTWYPDFVNESLFRQVADDWNCNLFRLAMYSSVYCGGEKEKSYALMKQGIDAAIASDSYVLVDWHILEDYDPNQNLEGAVEFFDRISSEYSNEPNLIFEICNEPNGGTDWSDVMRYSEKVIPVIRSHCPQAVIVVGTPEYDRNLGDALMRPLDFDNIMYVLHFYAASHKDGLRDELKSAVEAGLPVFISECGICEADGDGTIHFASATQWFTYLNEQKISYAIWSLSDKDESSAFFKPGFSGKNKIRDSDLTASGRWVRELIRGNHPQEISVDSPVVKKTTIDWISTWITGSLGARGYQAIAWWLKFAGAAAIIVLGVTFITSVYMRNKKWKIYDDIAQPDHSDNCRNIIGKVLLLFSSTATVIYLCWRIFFSIPMEAGAVAVAANIILLIVEVLGFIESLVLFRNLMERRNHPLPSIPDEEYPDVDIFIATYNEPVELLRRTVNGCNHLDYPDPSRVHVWICDDNRRAGMRALAEEMGVGYFDRPDNNGAKAGNLNHAMSLTSAPYIVTLDADMIPKSDFLMKTIPYFVDAETKNRELPEDRQIHLGLLQTPQCFYDPDVFQHALYSEKRAPNEQDFFYRTIEPGRTSTNSVIYGGSNTVLSRRALNDIGGFYTESITEDFATGVLIESAGYVSLGLPEPLASGETPHTFREHIQQRTRWGRGVIVTARKLRLWRRKNLSLTQKISYWSSVVYWYSPIKNLIYMLSPLMFATFALPVFKCNWLELLGFWLPMFLLQDSSLCHWYYQDSFYF